MSAAVVPGHFILAQAEKSSCVVIEDVPLLLQGEKVCGFDCVDGQFDGIRPHHLIRAEQDALPETGFNNPAQVAVKFRPGQAQLITDTST
jgi:hypothetical protein